MAKMKKITIVCSDDFHTVHLIQATLAKGDSQPDLKDYVEEIAKYHNWKETNLHIVGVMEDLVTFADGWEF